MSLVAKPVDAVSVRDKILTLEDAMRRMPQVEIPPVHYFAKGIYAREIFIPKGTLLTGKIHKTEHLNIISKGDISVVTEEGTKRIQAPFTMVAVPGTKRVGYAHKEGSVIIPHVHWMPSTADVGDVKWQMEYIWINRGGDCGGVNNGWRNHRGGRNGLGGAYIEPLHRIWRWDDDGF